MQLFLVLFTNGSEQLINYYDLCKPLIDCSSNTSWASRLTWLDNYWLDNYWLDNYWLDNYWLDNYWLDNYWLDNYWLDNYWLDNYWLDNYWLDNYWLDNYWLDNYWLDNYWLDNYWLDNYWLDNYWLDNYWLDLRLDFTSRPATRTRAFSNSRLDSTREYATFRRVWVWVLALFCTL